MAMVVKNNMAAMRTLGEMNKNSGNLSKSLKKVGSGMRITGAGDAASEYSISEKMRVKLRGLEQDDRNLQNGMSFVKIGLGGMQEIIDTLRNMRELALGAANDTMTDDDRRISQKVLDQYIDNIDDIATGTVSNYYHVLMPTSESRPELAGKADFVFSVDVTGSMGSYIEKIASQIGSFATKLRDLGLEPRFGLVSYGDVGLTGASRSTDPYEKVIKRMDFTEDADAFATALNALRTTMAYGGDGPESGLEGIMDPDEGALAFDWAADSIRHIINLSDAELKEAGSDAYGVARYTIPETIDAIKAKGVKAHVFGPTSGTGYTQWHSISQATKGEYFSIGGDYERDLDTLLETMKVSDVSYVRIHDGTKANQNIKIDIYDHRAKALKLREFVDGTDDQYDTIKITTRQQAVDALDKVDFALERELDRATTYGAYINRMEYSRANVTTAAENTQGAESVIRDADMAKEMTEYTKNNVLLQASQSMLAQANQNLSGVLSLLQ